MTEIFDNIMAELLSRKALTKERMVKVVLKALEDAPGMTPEDSAYFDHDLVQGALKELYPAQFGEANSA